MNHLDYFSDRNLAIDFADNENLKIKGLSFLPGDLKDQVLKYAKCHKQQILIELQLRDGVIPCPARCKKNDKCYGIVWFTGKPGKFMKCTPGQCPWADQLKQYLKREKHT